MKDNKLGIMPISKLIWNMSLPIIVSMLVQALYNIVDSVFVSQVSEQALTAVTLAFPAQNLMIGLATGTAVGVNALLGRALGAGDGKRADQVAINGIFLAVVGFVLSAVLALCFAGTFFRTQTDIDYIVDNGITYLRICCCASLGMFCEIMFERLLQGTGRSILSMYTQGLGAIVNIVLDPIFIFVFKMGVVGAAVATVIGQFCGCGLALYMNLRKNHDLHLRFRGFRPDWKIVGNIYAIGLPSVVMVAIGSVMTFCMNKILITYHSAKETAATAFGIYFKLNSFVFMPVFGLNNGVVPIVAYNYGAQNRRRMMETIKRSAIYASCIMVLGMAIFWAIPGTLVSIFNATETMKQVAVPALRIISLSFCTAGACIALGSSFQALGKSVYSMITSIIRQLMFLVPIAYGLARYGQSIGNDDLVWWCYPIAEIASLGVTMLFFLRVYRTVIAKVPLDGAPSLEEQELDIARQRAPKTRAIRYDNLRSATAEEGLICMLLREPELIADVKLPAEMFTVELFGRVLADLRQRLQAGRPVTLAALEADFTPEEMAHLSYIMSKDASAVSDEALTDYLRVIQEEYEDRSLTRSDESLRLLAEQMKQTKQYGG